MARGVLRAILPLLYEPLAPAYDLISRLAFAGEWAAWRTVAVEYATLDPIAEIGCGTGHVQAWAIAHNRRSVGIDLAAPMLRQARRRAAGRLVRGSAFSLPLRAASIGTVLSLFPTAYVLAPATWREAERVLRPGGSLVIATHGWLAPTDGYRRWLAGGHRLIYGGGGSLPALPATRLTRRTVIARSPHGWLHLVIAEQGR